MRLIDSKNNRFSDRNLVKGEIGTVVDAKWLNSLQDELENLIGKTNIDQNKTDQILTAVINLIKTHGTSVTGSTKADFNYDKIKHIIDTDLGHVIDDNNASQLRDAIILLIKKQLQNFNLNRTQLNQITNNTTDLQALKINVNKNTSDIATLSSKTTSTSIPANLTKEITDLKTSQASQDKKITKNIQDISNLQLTGGGGGSGGSGGGGVNLAPYASKISKNTADISNMTTSVADAFKKVTEHQTKIAENKKSIECNASTVKSVKDCCSEHEKLIQSNTQEIAVIKAIGTGRAILNQYYYTAKDKQTLFKGKDDKDKPLEFEENYLEIFLNGVHLNPEDYILSPYNQTITLKEPTRKDDEIYIRSYGSFSLPNAEITKIISIEKQIKEVAEKIVEISDVSKDLANINILSLLKQKIENLAKIANEIKKLGAINLAITTVAKNETNLLKVAGNEANITKVANNDANVTTVATDTKKINTVAKNISDVNNFADVYLGSYAKQPATRNDGSPLETGDLYFDTVKKSIFVYDKSKKDWILISSVIRSLLKQFYFKATDKQTVFKGNDSNNLPLEFEENYLEIFLNGVHLNPEDFTLDSVNQTITLKEPARKDDELYIRSYGSFAFPDKEVKAILSIKTQIENLDKKKNELQAVFNSLTNINDLASIKKQIENLEKIIADIKKVSAIDGAITTVSSIENQIKTLTTDIKKIDTVAKLETQIDTVAGIESQIKTIVANLQNLLNATAHVVHASESVWGISKIATQKETDDEKDDTVFVTPKKLINISKKIEYNSGKIEELETRDEEQQNLLDSNTLTASINKNNIAHLQTQQTNNTNDIVDLKNTDDAQLKLINKNNTAIAKIVADIKAGITHNKLKTSFSVPNVLYDKLELKGEEDTGAFGTAVAMTDKYLAISDPLSQEVVVYSRDKNNSKKWNLDEVHKGKQNEKISLEDGKIHIKNKDGIHVDVFTYDDTKTNLTFTKSQTITLNNSYGKSLAIDSNYLIIGVPQSKTALVYKHNGIQWRLVKELTGGNSFASDVAVNEKYIIIAEPDNNKVGVFYHKTFADLDDFKSTGRFKLVADAFINSPFLKSTLGLLGYTVADANGIDYYQVVQNLDDNSVNVRKFTNNNKGVWSVSNAQSFSAAADTNSFNITKDVAQRVYTTNQVNNKLMIGFYFLFHNNYLGNQDYSFMGYLFLEVETNILYYKCNDGYDYGYQEVSNKLKLDFFNKFMEISTRSVPYHNSTTLEDINTFKATNDPQGEGGSTDSDTNLMITILDQGVKKQFQLTGDDESAIYLKTKTGSSWGSWSSILGTRLVQVIRLSQPKIEKDWSKKEITGGTSYSKLVDAYEDVFSVAEPDNNILKIYYDTSESDSKTVKADCISLNHHKLLVTSKTAKLAYLYNLYIAIRTGWFTTKNTTWQGLPNNSAGYTGYSVKGGQYQLVRPIGTSDTYTKYNGQAWVKNGAWGGVLWYLGSKIGFEKKGDNQWHQLGNTINVGGSSRKQSISLNDADTIVALGNWNNGNYVEVYEIKNSTWVLKGKRITGTGEFGYAVNLSKDGNTVAVGADVGNYTEVYEYVGNSWVLKGQRITGSGSFGIAVYLSDDGNTCAVSSQTGNYAEVYEYKNNNWVLKGSRVSYTDAYALAMSADGNTFVINTNVYEYKNNSWQAKGGVLSVGGRSVDISDDGNTIITGFTSDSNGNFATVYEYKNNTWVAKGQQLRGSRDYSFSVSISSNGNTIAVSLGSRNKVELYKYVKGQWVLKGKVITGSGDFGGGVALSDDGNTLAVKSDTAGYVYSFKGNKQLYLDTSDGKHYYNDKEVKDDTQFYNIMETVAPLSTLPDPIVEANRNIKLTLTDIQEQPNKTGNYVSLLGTGTAITPTNIDDVSFPIDTNFGDACAVSDNEVMVANKTDNKLAVYDHKGTKIKDIQLDKDMGSVIDGTDKEVIVGSDTANKVEILDLK